MAQILTTLGNMDESILVKTTGSIDNEMEIIEWTEYRFEDEIVRRDVHIILKEGNVGVPVASF